MVLMASRMSHGQIPFVVDSIPVKQAFQGLLALRGKPALELVVDHISILWHWLITKIARSIIARINLPAYLLPWGWLFLWADVVWHENLLCDTLLNHLPIQLTMDITDLLRDSADLRYMFKKHAYDLTETFLLKPEQAAIQTYSDLTLEMAIYEEALTEVRKKLFPAFFMRGRDLFSYKSTSEHAAMAQKMFAMEDKLRLRQRPSHLKVTWNWMTKMWLPITVVAVAGSILLYAANITLPTTSSASAIASRTFSPTDYAAMASLWASEYFDHKSTINAFKHVDTMERNPLLPRYGHEIISQINGGLLVALVGISMPAYVLFLSAVAKGIATLGNKRFLKKRLSQTKDEFNALTYIYDDQVALLKKSRNPENRKVVSDEFAEYFCALGVRSAAADAAAEQTL